MAADDFGRFTIPIDGRWSLEDLYRFPRAFEQVYFALDAVLPANNEEVEGRVDRAFRAFPWQGGYSAVNFYNQLKSATPPQRRPRVESIQYASPGWLELSLYLGNVLILCFVVNRVANSFDVCNRVYNSIITDLMKRKLLRLEVERKRNELTRDELSLLREYSDNMANVLGIPSANSVHQRTHNFLISLKILLSIYRRVRILADYQRRGKASFDKELDANLGS